MRHFRTILLFLSILILGITGVSAQKTASGLSATQVLDKAVAALQKAPSLTMTMVFKNGNQSANATLVVAKEKFTYQTPGLRVLYDGTTQWTVNDDDSEISITEPTAEEIAETNPLAFVQSYKKNYNVSMVASDENSYTVQLMAKNKSSYIRSAKVTVNSKVWLPTKIDAALATGQTLVINFTTIAQGEELPVSKFRLDSKNFKDYEIIDLR